MLGGKWGLREAGQGGRQHCCPLPGAFLTGACLELEGVWQCLGGIMSP